MITLAAAGAFAASLTVAWPLFQTSEVSALRDQIPPDSKASTVEAADPSPWLPLFDGVSLEGWTRRGGEAEYRVEDGCIVGRTKPNQPNTFLCTQREFGDFELEFEFKVDRELNSGVQIRSHSRPEFKNGRVHGWQMEIDPSPRGWTAGLYDEGRRGWLQSPADDAPSKIAFIQDDWNRVRVVAEGGRVRSWLNEVPVVDFVDLAPEADASGFIGLQVHGVGARVDPLEVRWRNVRIRTSPTMAR
ncbi:MAG: 3-keto-disaccharide hydrolase [Phycisphaerales bacterium]